ncbi:HupE/UreJ family protein [Mesorhizobium sp.]|uniref:HupE/UreJ family protein n=1 Tax=Mesorhizobium sp. TaxID=1871066 RepID=UPI00257A965A|nr:HupE/UreJ family protein [Mesorhizobium sp.]
MVPLALFSFNVGVELGQLMFIAVVLVAIHLVQRVYELPRQAVVASAPMSSGRPQRSGALSALIQCSWSGRGATPRVQ